VLQGLGGVAEHRVDTDSVDRNGGGVERDYARRRLGLGKPVGGRLLDVGVGGALVPGLGAGVGGGAQQVSVGSEHGRTRLPDVELLRGSGQQFKGRGVVPVTDLARPTRFRDLAFPHRQRPERAVLDGGSQVVQEPRHAHVFLDVGDPEAVHTGRARPLVSRDSVKRHEQRRRVVHEVEQVIEPMARIGHRPTVKLGLHLRYPRPRPGRLLARSIAIRRRVFRHCSILPFSKPLPPFPMRAGFPRLGVLRRLRPTPDRSAVGAPSPTHPPDAGVQGKIRDGSRVH
jgi:hypothetical protein